MLIPTAEEAFRRGKAALSLNRRTEALALFEAAIELERRHGAGTIQARYLSYYGICLALATNRVREGIGFCRKAVLQEGYNADLQWNLGRSYLAAERRREAYDALITGLRLDARHRGIRSELRRMGRRRRPVLPFLSREHPLNVFLGKTTRPRQNQRSRAAR
jgi:tetratricopeptide (TPR) repeat protein